MTRFIPVSELAQAAGLTNRAIERAITRTVAGQRATWRGATLVVRKVHGRGGRSGIRYEVRVDSLPLELQERLRALKSTSESPLRHGEKAQQERDWWYGLIAPALVHERHSRARGAAIAEIVSRRHMRPDGRWVSVSERTVQRKIAAFEDEGYAGLARRKRADAGAPRVIVSWRWDKAVPLDDAGKHRIADALRQYVRGLHKAGEARALLADLASFKLEQLTRKAGCDLGAQASELCRVPQPFLDQEKAYRRVALLRRDRKTFEDQKPRVLRKLAGAPMEVVYGDIHPVDIVLRREDGSTAHARAIGWLDDATRRVWLDIILVEKGKGIRNRDVIQSFINMVNAWGAPRTLYLDNGSEYNWAEFIDDALQLLDKTGQPLIERVEPGRAGIVRAQPYNAAAKSIEGIFSVLERNYFQAVPGWIAGDRMKKKTSSVGGKVEPFPGTLEEFRDLIGMQIRLYHRICQQRGKLKGRSPDQAYKEAIDAGWTMTAVQADAFRLAFSHVRELTVWQGAISFKRERWTCRELVRWQERKISVRIPKYEDWNRLPLLDRDGNLVGFAERQHAYHPLDTAGAVEAREISRLHTKEVIAMARSAPDVDLLRERSAFLDAQPPAPVAPIGATIGASDEAERFLAAWNETPAERRKRERRERELKAHEEIESFAEYKAMSSKLRRAG
ncbi:hypothetical protein GGR16_003382 [Chelatococcus caeni]|uniref:Transposase n=1 Tax=Chelatococcus caeni TaxID=1348468 RepID=A0A840BYC3_9HYPH|nr:hypothetical protein [Chelatococcus caeni]MBB4018335.1 hypothetical protein [Chelatococcus caeni]